MANFPLPTFCIHYTARNFQSLHANPVILSADRLHLNKCRFFSAVTLVEYLLRMQCQLRLLVDVRKACVDKLK